MAVQLYLLFSVPGWAGAITKRHWNSNILKRAGLNNNLTKILSKSIQ